MIRDAFGIALILACFACAIWATRPIPRGHGGCKDGKPRGIIQANGGDYPDLAGSEPHSLFYSDEVRLKD